MVQYSVEKHLEAFAKGVVLFPAEYGAQCENKLGGF
jgi:hypothetical protein